MIKENPQDIEERIQRMMEHKKNEAEALKKILSAFGRKDTDLNIKPNDKPKKE